MHCDMFEVARIAMIITYTYRHAARRRVCGRRRHRRRSGGGRSHDAARGELAHRGHRVQKL